MHEKRKVGIDFLNHGVWGKGCPVLLRQKGSCLWGSSDFEPTVQRQAL